MGGDRLLRIRTALLALLPIAGVACLPIGRPWPSTEPIGGAADTRWPTLSVELLWRDVHGEVGSPGGVAAERILRTLRTSDLFRAVEPVPCAADWSARIEVEERSDRFRTSLVLADAAGAPLFQGTREGEWSTGDPVSLSVRGLLLEARERGIFVGGAP